MTAIETRKKFLNYFAQRKEYEAMRDEILVNLFEEMSGNNETLSIDEMSSKSGIPKRVLYNYVPHIREYGPKKYCTNDTDFSLELVTYKNITKTYQNIDDPLDIKTETKFDVPCFRVSKIC